jgi:hypothetical protein
MPDPPGTMRPAGLRRRRGFRAPVRGHPRTMVIWGADVTLTRVVIAAVLEGALVAVLVACARLIGR